MSTDLDGPREYEADERPLALRVSEGLRALVDRVGKLASWLIVPLVLITCMDVIIRKVQIRAEDGSLTFGLQNWLVNNVSEWFGSTLLQELEWHLHTGLFALVLAYGYIHNTHVRVDLVRETLTFRRKAWIEFWGLTILLVPYCLITTYFAFEYAYDSWKIGEISASTVGLSNRWIIKSVLVAGLLLTVVAGIAVWLQTLLVLFGEPNRRFDLMTLEWPEHEGMFIEGKRRLEIDMNEKDFQHSANASARPKDGDGDK